MPMTSKIKNKRSKRHLSKSGIFLIVGLIIILVPCLIFGGILLHAAINTGSPIFGDRYKGDLDPAITDGDINNLKESVSALDGVQSVEITLISGQLRVNVDTNDELTSEEIGALLPEIYKLVDEKLPITTYFTSSEDRKMYDLAFNAYNFIDAENDGMIYYILTKNAMMEEYSVQLVSEPIDADLASDLRGENVTPTPSSQNTVE